MCRLQHSASSTHSMHWDLYAPVSGARVLFYAYEATLALTSLLFHCARLSLRIRISSVLINTLKNNIASWKRFTDSWTSRSNAEPSKCFLYTCGGLQALYTIIFPPSGSLSRYRKTCAVRVCSYTCAPLTEQKASSMTCRRKHNDELLGDRILSEILIHVVFQVRGPCVAGGGPITAAV